MIGDYDSEDCASLPYFGIGFLALTSAADFIAKCLYCEGLIETDYDGEIVSLENPDLSKALSKEVKYYLEKLKVAVQNGSLKAEVINRDIDENLIANRTYVDGEILYDWLRERGIELGDLYYHDYLSRVGELHLLLTNTLKTGLFREQFPDVATGTPDTTPGIFYDKLKEIQRLKDELAQAKDMARSSLTTRTRDTAFKLIIGMALAGYKYNPKAGRNPAVTEITEDLQRLGLQLDVDTVRKWSSDASQLLDTFEMNDPE